MKALRIVIDGRMYSESGIGRYIKNLIENLQALDQTNEYFVLLTAENFNTLEFHSTRFNKVITDFRWYGIAEQVKLFGLLKSLKADLVHFPHFNVPIFYQGKFVVTIHDLIHQHFSMKRATTHGPIIYKIKQIGYRLVFKNALKKSLKILVPSNFVKDQLVKDWQINPEKIVVTPEAVENNIVDLSKKSNTKILDKFNIRKPYIFYVGNAHPHKNVEGLIKVFKDLSQRHPDLSLVLAGHDHYFWQKIKKEYQHSNLIFTGFVSDEQLVALYKNAVCFVMPSFEEGFGIPLLEAMSCFCPVVSSNAGSLKEVGGNAAIYFDPYNKEDMESKISMVLESASIRKDLILKGRARVKNFSWQKLTEQTLEVYENR